MKNIGFHIEANPDLARNCECSQFFIGSPMQYKINESIAERDFAFCNNIYIHVSYGSYITFFEPRQRAIAYRYYEAVASMANRIQADIVTHIGSAYNDIPRAISKAVKSLQVITANLNEGRKFILENSAGTTTLVGNLDFLQEIFSQLGSSNKVGVCLDTAHCWSYGYDLRDTQALAHISNVFNNKVPLSLIHINGSKTTLGGGRDKHAWFCLKDVPYDTPEFWGWINELPCEDMIIEGAGEDLDSTIEYNYLKEKLTCTQ